MRRSQTIDRLCVHPRPISDGNWREGATLVWAIFLLDWAAPVIPRHRVRARKELEIKNPGAFSPGLERIIALPPLKSASSICPSSSRTLETISDATPQLCAAVTSSFVSSQLPRCAYPHMLLLARRLPGLMIHLDPLVEPLILLIDPVGVESSTDSL